MLPVLVIPPCLRVSPVERSDGPELTEVPPGTHKLCRKTSPARFPYSRPIRHCFPFKAGRGFARQSEFDSECAEKICFPSRGGVSIDRENEPKCLLRLDLGYACSCSVRLCVPEG